MMASFSQEDSSRNEAGYNTLVRPSNHWALNFILNTVSIEVTKDSIAMGMPSGDPYSIIVGSYAQKLCCKPMLMGRSGRYSMMSDYDIMQIDPFFVVDDFTKRDFVSNSPVYLYSQTTDTHPGYLRLPMKESSPFAKEEYTVKRGSQVYISSDILFEGLELLFGYEGGPSCKLPMAFPGIQDSGDLVPSFKCCTWPAKDWQMRERLSGWPCQELIEKIVSDGCHVVSKAHPKSSESDAKIEFRYSFSVAEIDICKSLSPQQRKCMKLFRLVVMDGKGDLSSKDHGLSSYHLKTVLFWLCEKVPAPEWTHETIGNRLLDLLGQLLVFLEDRNIPNFFMPENNMIDHLSKSDILCLVRIAGHIRKDPVGHLLANSLLSEMFDNSLCNILQPVMAALGHADKDRRLRACSQVLQRAARLVVKFESGWESAMDYMNEQSELLQVLGFEMSPSLLLSILFVDHYKFQYDDCSYEMLSEVASFLHAQCCFREAIAVLLRAETLLNATEDNDVTKCRRMYLYAMLMDSFGRLGEKNEARKYSDLYSKLCFKEVNKTQMPDLFENRYYEDCYNMSLLNL